MSVWDGMYVGAAIALEIRLAVAALVVVLGAVGLLVLSAAENGPPGIRRATDYPPPRDEHTDHEEPAPAARDQVP